MPKFNIKKILVPLDFSKTSLNVVDYAADMAKRCEAEIILLHVAEGMLANAQRGFYVPPSFETEYIKSVTEQGNKQLSKIAASLEKKGIRKVSTLVRIGRIHKEIIDAAAKTKADIILMGTHGVSGIRELFIGSNTFSVIRDSKCPVLSIRQHNKQFKFKNILMPFSDKPHSREKVNYAIDMALLYGSTIHVLGLDTEFTKSHKKKIELEAAQIKEIAKHKNVLCKTKVISQAYIADRILKHALKVKADLIIVMSNLDRMDITEYFTGPFSQQIVNHSPIPVLSIHPKFNTDTVDLRFY